MKTEYYWRDILNVEHLERIAKDLRQRIAQGERQVKIMDRYEDSKMARERMCDNTKTIVTIKEYLLRRQRYNRAIDENITELNKINYTIQVLKIAA